jgi:hypothetical protein
MKATGGHMREIIEKEAVRRAALYQEAIDLIAPITQTVKLAKENKAIAGLHLYPPDSRSTTTVFGLLLCRSFHAGIGRRHRRYVLSISPREGTIYVALEEGYYMDEDEAERYEDNVDIVWAHDDIGDGEPEALELAAHICRAGAFRRPRWQARWCRRRCRGSSPSRDTRPFDAHPFKAMDIDQGPVVPDDLVPLSERSRRIASARSRKPRNSAAPVHASAEGGAASSVYSSLA